MAVSIDPGIIEIARKYTNELKSHKINFKSVWLFGSHAKNRAHDDSDIDIAIVLGEDFNFEKAVELSSYRRNIDLRIETHVISDDDISQLFFKEIEQTGIKVA